MKNTHFLVLLSIILILCSCTSVASPPYLGVFLRDGSNLTPLDQFTGPPQETPEASVDISNPTFTVWLEGFDPQNFLLVSYTSADRIKNQVALNLRPLQEEGMYDVLVGELPEPDVYCFVLVDSLSVLYRMPHWCFTFNQTQASVESQEAENTPTAIKPSVAIVPTFSPQAYETDPYIPITPQNVENLIKISQIGDSFVGLALPSPDGSKFAITSGDGLFILDNPDMQKLSVIPLKGTMVTMVFSPDSKTLATCTHNGTIQLWNTSDGLHITNFEGEVEGLGHLLFSPDGQNLVFAYTGGSGIIRVWNVASGKLIYAIHTYDGYLPSIAISPNGSFLAYASDATPIILYRFSDGELLRELGDLSKDTNTLIFSPDSKLLVSGSRNGIIYAWNIMDGLVAFRLIGHSDDVTQILFSPDEHTIASTSYDGTIRTWNVDNGELIHLMAGNSDQISAMKFSPDGKVLAASSLNGAVLFWDSSRGDLIREIAIRDEYLLGSYDVYFSPDGKTLLSWYLWNQINIWGASDGKLINSLTDDLHSITTFDISPDEKYIVTGSTDKTVRIWDITNSTYISLTGHNGMIQDVALSSDGKVLASTSSDNSVRLWAFPEGNFIKSISNHPGCLNSLVAFSPDNDFLATAGKDMCIWQTTDGSLLHEFQTGSNTVFREMSFTPDGEYLIANTYSSMGYEWRIPDGTLIKTLDGTFRFSISSDGQNIAVISPYENKIRVFGVEDSSLTNTQFTGNSFSADIIFSPDGSMIATNSRDNIIALWNKQNGSKICEIYGGNLSNRLYHLSFTPDNQALVFDSSDTSFDFLRVSDCSTIKSIEVDGGSYDFRFTQNGEKLLRLNHFGLLEIWGIND